MAGLLRGPGWTLLPGPISFRDSSALDPASPVFR